MIIELEVYSRYEKDWQKYVSVKQIGGQRKLELYNETKTCQG